MRARARPVEAKGPCRVTAVRRAPPRLPGEAAGRPPGPFQTRRDLFRRAAAAALGTLLGSCVAGPAPNPTPSAAVAPPTSAGASFPATGRRFGGALRILQGTHPIEAFDRYLDGWAADWGAAHGVSVRIDRIPPADVPARAAAEAAAKAGHDLVAFVTNGLAASYAATLVEIDDVCDRAASRYGSWLRAGEALGKANGRWYAYPDYLAPFVSMWRPALWSRVGFAADRLGSWSDIIDRAPALKAADRPIGSSLGTNTQAEHAWRSLLWSYGGAEFTADGRAVAIDSPETRAALEVAKALVGSMDPNVDRWNDRDPAAFLGSGRGSWVYDSLAGYRTIEAADPALATTLALDPTPAGPNGRVGSGAFALYGIWSFSPNVEAARQFLIDYSDDWPNQFRASAAYNVPFLSARLAKPMPLLGADPRLAGLQDAAHFVQPIGYPGPPTRAAFDALSDHVVPDLFRGYATGKRTLEQGIGDAAKRLGESLARFP